MDRPGAVYSGSFTLFSQFWPCLRFHRAPRRCSPPQSLSAKSHFVLVEWEDRNQDRCEAAPAAHICQQHWWPGLRAHAQLSHRAPPGSVKSLAMNEKKKRNKKYTLSPFSRLNSETYYTLSWLKSRMKIYLFPIYIKYLPCESFKGALSNHKWCKRQDSSGLPTQRCYLTLLT